MAATVDPPVAPPADRVLEITRVFDAPRALVFRAWTEPEHLFQWAAPRGFSITHGEGDVRPGGAWRSCMVSPDGVEHWVGGIYREVVKDERLDFTHIWDGEGGKTGHETQVTLTFANAPGGGTKMTFHQAIFKSVGSRDGHRGGWTESFDRLGEHLQEIQKTEAANGR